MEIGTQVGPYRIDGLLGKGGMAEVYKAWHSGLHCHHALKVLPRQMTFDHSLVQRFLKEARLAGGLQHPNIASIHTVSEADAEQPYFAMEMVQGEDLADAMAARGRYSLAEALPILRQIGAALDFAHSKGLRHRDVKPANVLLRREGANQAVKVVDFGIASAQAEQGDKRLTRTGMIVGTPEYMSPEQGGSGAAVDHRTDQYSLAVIAYEMLCGAPPFQTTSESSMISVIMQHVRDTPRAPKDRIPGLPKAANAAIMKALAKNPADRFDSCAAFVDALGGSVVVKVVKNTTELESSTGGKSPLRFLPVVLGLIAIACIGLVSFGSRGDETIVEVVAPPVETETRVVPPPVPQAKVSVPSLQGKSEADAKQLLKDNSLVADITTAFSNTVRKQTVISQDPAAGTSVAKSAKVKVAISLGPSGGTPAQTPAAPPGGSAQAPTQVSTEWTTYRYFGLGWSMEVPVDWHVEPSYSPSDRRTRVQFNGPGDAFILVDVSAGGGGASALAAWQEMDGRFRKGFKSRYSLISLREAPLGGEPGAAWEFTIKKKDKPLLQKIDYGASHNGDGYAMLVAAPPASFEALRPGFERVYQSFDYRSAGE